jgi:hypothetical protein
MTPAVLMVSMPLMAAAQADACGDAIPMALVPGTMITLSGDNTDATAEGDFEEGSDLFGNAVVWHTFITESCMDVTLSYCGQDTIWETTWGFLFLTCPATEDSMIFPSTFNTEECPDGNTTYHYFSLQPGTYHVAVLLSEEDNAVGPYELTLSGESCTNDVCDYAVPMPLNVEDTLQISGDNTNATATADWAQGSIYEGLPVMWHAFTTATCSNIHVSYCGQEPAWDSVLAVLFSTCPGNENLALTAMNLNDTACADGNYSFYFPIVPAGTYFLPVLLDAASDAVGPYTLEVYATACGNVENDHCQLAMPELLVPGDTLTFMGDNTNATADYDWVPGHDLSDTAASWHAFTSTACDALYISYCGTDPAWTEFMGQLATDCPADQLIAHDMQMPCEDETGNMIFVYNNLPEGTYYIPVVNQMGGSGPYEIMVYGMECAPTAIGERSRTELHLFPNPVEGSFTLDNGGSSDVILVEMIDLSGRIARTNNHRIVVGGTAQIDVNGLGHGIYVVRSTMADGQRSEQRIVVQ